LDVVLDSAIHDLIDNSHQIFERLDRRFKRLPEVRWRHGLSLDYSKVPV